MKKPPPKRGPMDPLKRLEKMAKTWETYAREWYSGTARTQFTKAEALQKAAKIRAEIARLKQPKPMG